MTKSLVVVVVVEEEAVEEEAVLVATVIRTNVVMRHGVMLRGYVGLCRLSFQGLSRARGLSAGCERNSFDHGDDTEV